jgi:GNAT superfamily N-acetyltransferase
MKTIILRQAEPEHDFGQLAAWFTLLEDEPTTEPGLKEWYAKNLGRIIQIAAQDESGKLLGFYWATRDRMVPERFNFFLFVKPEERGQGIGRQLYQDWERAAREFQAKVLRLNVWDNCPECRTFAERRGFNERSHQLAMTLDLNAFDDRPYDEIISRLQSEGFRFTSMEALGNTEEAQRKLYALNDATSLDTPGADGENPWASFEDFQERVCRAEWYLPDGQMVVFDTANHGTAGPFVAMSAITRLKGAPEYNRKDYAYNLHTGVDRRHRGRKLAQAVKVLALRYARDVLKVDTVRTHHNAQNLPMIAIDRKFGYVQTPGTFSMEKRLE